MTEQFSSFEENKDHIEDFFDMIFSDNTDFRDEIRRLYDWYSNEKLRKIPPEIQAQAEACGVRFMCGAICVPVTKPNGNQSWFLTDREQLEIAVSRRWKIVERHDFDGYRYDVILPRGGGQSFHQLVYGTTLENLCFINDEREESFSLEVCADYRSRIVWNITEFIAPKFPSLHEVPENIFCHYDGDTLFITFYYAFSRSDDYALTPHELGGSLKIYKHEKEENYSTVTYENNESIFHIDPLTKPATMLADFMVGEIRPEMIGFRKFSGTVEQYYNRKRHSIKTAAEIEWRYSSRPGCYGEKHYTVENWYYNGFRHDDPQFTAAIATVQSFARKTALNRRISQRENVKELKNNLVQSIRRLPAGAQGAFGSGGCGRFLGFPGGEEYREILEECAD